MDADVVAHICSNHKIFVCPKGWLSIQLSNHMQCIMHIEIIDLILDATDRPLAKIKKGHVTKMNLGLPHHPDIAREAKFRLNDFMQELWNYYYYNIQP